MKSAYRLYILVLSVTGIVPLSYAQPVNNNCANAINLTVGANCYMGSNLSATTELGEPTLGGCWGTAADKTVWFKFTTGVAGYYEITCDNGDNADTQMKLYSGGCPGINEIGCSDDDGVSNALAAVIVSSLAATTQYWIQVDIYGAATTTFCIRVAYIPTPSNDCVLNATDITSVITPVSTSNPFNCNYNYVYNASTSTVDDPTQQTITGDPNGCNGVNVITPRTGHYDVWLKFTVDASTPPAYLIFYPLTGTFNMDVALYSGTPVSICPTGAITGLVQIDWLSVRTTLPDVLKMV